MVKIKTRIDSSRWSSGTNTYEKKAKCRRSSITTTTNVETGDVTGIERRFYLLDYSPLSHLLRHSSKWVTSQVLNDVLFT